MNIWYLPLESYRERYTEQLLNWTVRAFERRHLTYHVVLGDTLAKDQRITLGPVLDARGRSYWALTQMARLVTHIDAMHPEDWIFIEDLFTPGYEALPYIFWQSTTRPRIATRNYAQSVDPDDFTFAMLPWMRPYEQMVDETADHMFVASTVHQEMWQAAGLGRFGTGAVIDVVGLPFDSDAVRAQGPADIMPWKSRPKRVVYSSRLDREKQPNFFMDLVEQIESDYEFVVCTGADAPRSNDLQILRRLQGLEQDGKVTIAAGLTKQAYYAILASSRVHLNTARQDFVSFTACEASTFHVPTLAPAFRSFPEALHNRETQLYVPWSLNDAVGRLHVLMQIGEPRCQALAEEQDKTLDKMIDVFEGKR